MSIVVFYNMVKKILWFFLLKCFLYKIWFFIYVVLFLEWFWGENFNKKGNLYVWIIFLFCCYKCSDDNDDVI